MTCIQRRIVAPFVVIYEKDPLMFRNSRNLDLSSEEGAAVLMKAIKFYWSSRGVPIEVWAIKHSEQGAPPLYMVRSRFPNGMPFQTPDTPPINSRRAEPPDSACAEAA